MTYRSEADALDAHVLSCIRERAVADFDSLALRIFEHQLRYNAPYARYCASLGVTPACLPASWEEIPPVPSAAFKESALCTFDPAAAALAFETSGTTTGTGGTHYMERSDLYDAALLAGFSDAMLSGESRPLRYLLLVSNPSDRPRSSLGYMMRKVAATFGDGNEQWYLEGDTLHVDRFADDARRAAAENAPVCLAGTAFAFVQLLDALQERGIASLPLPAGSRVMETGGFKGRTRIVERGEMYAQIARTFGLAPERIVAEYGMTELTSQYYDRVPAASAFDAPRVKHAPPWLRPRVIGPNGRSLAPGTLGTLVHVDLANRSSCIAVQTEDWGVRTADGGLILIGRERGAALRGCSLDAEELRART